MEISLGYPKKRAEIAASLCERLARDVSSLAWSSDDLRRRS